MESTLVEYSLEQITLSLARKAVSMYWRTLCGVVLQLLGLLRLASENRRRQKKP
jgi:hypothetical protein